MQNLYFYVGVRASTRSCTYNKGTMQAALTEALNKIPVEQRPTLWEIGMPFHVFAIRDDAPNIKGPFEDANRAIHFRQVRRLLETAVRSVHTKAAYGFGFDDPSIDMPPARRSFAYHTANGAGRAHEGDDVKYGPKMQARARGTVILQGTQKKEF